jgi:ACS family pantothenate transporter-like MFS transporter
MKALLIRFGDAIHWYPKGITHEEKVLIFKIDSLVLVYACLSFFAKYLDITALSKRIFLPLLSVPTYQYMLTLYGTAANAYVSGMQEDLDLYGNRLNYVNAVCRPP